MKRRFFLFFLYHFSVAIFAQKQPAVDFKHLEAQLTLTPQKGQISGDLVFTFDVLKPTDSIFIDARKMTFSDVLLNNKSVEISNDGQHLWLIDKFQLSEDNQFRLKYASKPQQAMYFIKTSPEDVLAAYQVWTQGQGKYTSNWLPSFDDTSEKLEFDLTVDYPKGKAVLANGVLKEQTSLNDSTIRWKFDMQDQMSSYLVAIAAGDFDKIEKTSQGGVQMEFFYPKGKEELVEPTYRHSTEIMDFLEEKLGVGFPWQNYKQVPVQDFLYAGMENTGTTIFSDLLLVDSIGYNDRNYVNVNAHELAHQWFGDLVTAANREDHWLQEGFATYYALLAEKAIFGEDYFYWKLFQSAEELKEMSDSGKGEAVVNANASSLTYYQKGAWALYILNNLIGEEVFDLAVKNYLEKYSFENASTEDFLTEVEKVTEKDLTNFRKDWLEQSAFQGAEALENLKKSEFIQKYLGIAAARQLPLESKKSLLSQALDFPVNDYTGQEAVHQLAFESVSEVIDLYKKAFSTNNLYVRQAIALTMSKIPQELKKNYESLLDDNSYVTKEAALFNLWNNFPEEREKYLSKMAKLEGFSDKNVRTLWLALNVATPTVPSNKKQEYLKELSSYTAPHQKFQLREKAFDLLFQLKAFQREDLENLIEATKHHNYRFRQHAKELLKALKDSATLKPEDQTLLEQNQ